MFGLPSWSLLLLNVFQLCREKEGWHYLPARWQEEKKQSLGGARASFQWVLSSMELHVDTAGWDLKLPSWDQSPGLVALLLLSITKGTPTTSLECFTPANLGGMFYFNFHLDTQYLSSWFSDFQGSSQILAYNVVYPTLSLGYLEILNFLPAVSLICPRNSGCTVWAVLAGSEPWCLSALPSPAPGECYRHCSAFHLPRDVLRP